MWRAARVGAIDDQVWTARDRPVAKKPGQQRRRAVATVLLVLVGAGIAYVPVAMTLSRWEYGTSSFWKAPVRIDYCGRRYLQNEVTVAGKEVMRTYALEPIYAEVLTSHPNSAVCAFFLYVPAGNQRWWTYVLSGGP
jgi:hypothetical protein